MNIEQPSEGEVLLLICKRSGKTNTEIAKMLDIHPNHLSKLFKSEKLTQKIKLKIEKAFGVSTSIFSSKDIYSIPRPEPEIEEPEMPYMPSTLRDITAADVLEYLREKDQQHFEERSTLQKERAILLKIIDNLTKK